MDSAAGYGPVPPSGRSLFPLAPSHRAGLTAVTALATLSLVASSMLFSHLTIKLFQYYRRRWRRNREIKRAAASSSDGGLDLGLHDHHFSTTPSTLSDVDNSRKGYTEPNQATLPLPPPNQFVVLLYNLMLADMHQAMAFFLNISWIVKDGIFVQTGPCWTQGWFVSTGDLSASCFILAIAFHTYFTVVRGWKPSQVVFNWSIVGVWLFVYGATLAGIAGTNNGKTSGGYYVRAVAWCWINGSYEILRLVTHYLFIFISIVLTSILYILIFLHARKEGQQQEAAAARHKSIRPISSAPMDPSRTSAIMAEMDMPARSTTPSSRTMMSPNSGHHPAFLMYPLIYVVCTLPLATGRIAGMAGATVPITYFCAAAALIVSNGWLDALLWGSTRRSLVFGDIESEDSGLASFTFMRTPASRKFGNHVWVQGQSDIEMHYGGSGDRSTSVWNKVRGGRSAPIRRDVPAGAQVGELSRIRSVKKSGSRSTSQESLHRKHKEDLGMNIQLDLVTSVVYEIDPDKKRRVRKNKPSQPSTDLYHGSLRSLSESEKDFHLDRI